MPIFTVYMKHLPEICPFFNNEIKEMLKEKSSKREEIGKQHEIKVLTAVTSLFEHMILYVVEAPSQPAVEKYFNEIGFAPFNTIKIKQVVDVEDVFKKL